MNIILSHHSTANFKEVKLNKMGFSQPKKKKKHQHIKTPSKIIIDATTRSSLSNIYAHTIKPYHTLKKILDEQNYNTSAPSAAHKDHLQKMKSI